MRGCRAIAAGVILALAGTAGGLLYLPDQSLESMLVRSPQVVIASVESVDGDQAALAVSDALKGTAEETVTVRGVNLRITRDKLRPRFAQGDNVVAFLAVSANGTRVIEHAQTLPTAADVRTMKACITEVLPFAETLHDLANPRQPVNEDKVVAAVRTLAASRNGFTQIAVGRWMRTVLPARLKPELCTAPIVAAIATGRTELQLGALAWAAKYAVLPADVRAAIETVAKESQDDAVVKDARRLLEARPKETPATQPPPPKTS